GSIMERRIIKVLAICIVVFSACYYDSEESLYPNIECVTTAMSYQTNIVPILERNCYVCHSAAVNLANITLEGHSQLIKHTTGEGRLLGAINHLPGFSRMPKNASKLLPCDIAKIEQWILDGSPNN
ncbi:MAG: hypothetical protein ABIQ11_05975, partial [Saprospiraceae bacterium]